MASKEESRDNAARRNRAARKIRAARHIDPEIKLAIEVILDLLSQKSGYCIAWPSAATIAGRLQRGRRTGKWYLRTIRALGIFKCKELSPNDARVYCNQKYGFEPKFDRCIKNAPILFEPNLDHSLWDSSAKLSTEVDEKMGEIIRRIKAKRNAKTTSSLALTPIEKFRKRIRKTNCELRNDRTNTAILAEAEQERELLNGVANDPILMEAEDERRDREELLNGVANDIIRGVANDTQVFGLSSAVANESFPPSIECPKSLSQPSFYEGKEKGLPSGNPACSPCKLNTPPTHHSAHSDIRNEQNTVNLNQARGSHGGDGVIAPACSECRSAGSEPVRHKNVWFQRIENLEVVGDSLESEEETENLEGVIPPLESEEDSRWKENFEAPEEQAEEKSYEALKEKIERMTKNRRKVEEKLSESEN